MAALKTQNHGNLRGRRREAPCGELLADFEDPAIGVVVSFGAAGSFAEGGHRIHSE